MASLRKEKADQTPKVLRSNIKLKAVRFDNISYNSPTMNSTRQVIKSISSNRGKKIFESGSSSNSEKITLKQLILNKNSSEKINLPFISKPIKPKQVLIDSKSLLFEKPNHFIVPKKTNSNKNLNHFLNLQKMNSINFKISSKNINRLNLKMSLL